MHIAKRATDEHVQRAPADFANHLEFSRPSLRTGVSIPQQSRGFRVWSRSKRLVRVAPVRFLTRNVECSPRGRVRSRLTSLLYFLAEYLPFAASLHRSCRRPISAARDSQARGDRADELGASGHRRPKI